MAASERGAGVFLTSLSLVTCTAGAGVLSFPLAVAQAGIVPVVLLTLVFAALAGYCNLILAEFAWRHRGALDSRAFDQLVFLTLGEGHHVSVGLQVILGLIGALTGFFCVAADLGVPVASRLCQAAAAAGGSPLCSALASRGGVVLCFAGLVVLPLASCARIAHLRLPSALAVASILFVVGLVVARGAMPQQAQASLLPLVVPSAQGFLQAAPIAIYALGNHVQSVSIFLDASERSMQRYHLSVALCYAVIVALYVSTGVGGYLAFGSAVRGNVLTNFALGSPVVDAAKALMALHVALVIAVDTIPLRRSLHLMAGRCRAGGGCRAAAAPRGGWEVQRAQAEAAQAEEDALPHICGTPCSLGILAHTAGILALSGGLAILFPQVNVVFGLLGSTLGVTCMWGYPALMLLSWARQVEQQEQQQVQLDAEPLLELELELAGLSIQAHTGVVMGEGGAGGGRLEGRAPRTLGYLPTSPFWLRAQGGALLLLSAVVAVACTAEYVAVVF